MYVSVINDGGFTFGMDLVTPVSWVFHKRPRSRGVYRCWRIAPAIAASPAFRAWLERNPSPVMSYNDLAAVLRSCNETAPI